MYVWTDHGHLNDGKIDLILLFLLQLRINVDINSLMKHSIPTLIIFKSFICNKKSKEEKNYKEILLHDKTLYTNMLKTLTSAPY